MLKLKLSYLFDVQKNILMFIAFIVRSLFKTFKT